MEESSTVLLDSLKVSWRSVLFAFMCSRFLGSFLLKFQSQLQARVVVLARLSLCFAPLQSIWSSSMMQPGPSALEQLLLQQKQKQQRGHGTMNPPH